MALATNLISEAAGIGATRATITIDIPLTNTLSVLVFNSDPTEVSVPTSVSIPVGSNSVSFAVDAVNDGELDGTQLVTLTVDADGFLPTSATLQVADDDVAAHRTIGGKLFGTLATNTYWVIGDVTVEAGHTLTIEPSSILLFEAGKGLTIAGTLVAAASESAEIRFTSALAAPTNGSWKGITITSSGAPQTTVDYVEIAFAQTGLLVIPSNDQVNLVLGHSAIHHCSLDGVEVHGNSGITIESNAVQVVSNQIHHNGRHGVQVYSKVYGCDSGSRNSATIVGNDIFENLSAGVRLYADADTGYGCKTATRRSRVNSWVSNNSIHGNLYGIWGNARKGFVASVGSLNPTIQNNLIVNNTQDGIRFDAGVGAYNGAFAELYPTVVNNTIFGNAGSAIIHATNTLAGFVIRNNLVIQNNYGIRAATTLSNAGVQVGFNDVWGNSLGNWINYPMGYGTPVTNNLNGTAADAMMNISADPLFAGGEGFRLQPISPAVDAGTTNLAPSLDFEGQKRSLFPDLGCEELATVLLKTASPPKDGRFTILVIGGRAVSCSIEATTNFHSWTVITNVTLTDRMTPVVLPVQPNVSQMFYRASLLP